MASIVELNRANFDSVVYKPGATVLIDFWAPWCGPCRMQAPILEKLAASQDITATIAKINTDENPELASRFGISSIPTLIIMKDGSEAERFVGVQPESLLRAKLTGRS